MQLIRSVRLARPVLFENLSTNQTLTKPVDKKETAQFGTRTLKFIPQNSATRGT
jgi:hypothetical protein